jgi:hypothetical protein
VFLAVRALPGHDAGVLFSSAGLAGCLTHRLTPIHGLGVSGNLLPWFGASRKKRVCDGPHGGPKGQQSARPLLTTGTNSGKPSAPAIFCGLACCTQALAESDFKRRWLRQICSQYVAEVCERFEGVCSGGGRCRQGAHRLGLPSHAWTAHPSAFRAPAFGGAFVTPNCVSVARWRGCLRHGIA